MLCPRCLRANDEEREVFHCPSCSYECSWPEAQATQPLLRWRVAETRGTPPLPPTCDFCNQRECTPVRIDWKKREGKLNWAAATQMVGLVTSQDKVTRCTGLYGLCRRCARSVVGPSRAVQWLTHAAAFLLCLASLCGFLYLAGDHLPKDLFQTHPIMGAAGFLLLYFPGLLPYALMRPDANYPTPFPIKLGFTRESAARWKL